MSKNPQLVLPFFIFVVICKLHIILVAHFVVASGLTVFSEDLNMLLFKRKHISSHADKLWLIQTLGVLFAIFLFSIATIIMLMRIFTGKANPATHADPVYISTLNRVITNTIEQTIIFVGLYSPILFGESDSISRIGGTKALAIVSIFIVGRIFFGIGYGLASATGIVPFRSFGFTFSFILNVILISYHLGFDSFGFLDKHIAPTLQHLFS